MSRLCLPIPTVCPFRATEVFKVSEYRPRPTLAGMTVAAGRFERECLRLVSQRLKCGYPRKRGQSGITNRRLPSLIAYTSQRSSVGILKLVLHFEEVRGYSKDSMPAGSRVAARGTYRDRQISKRYKLVKI